jgi:hypothetical protein
MSRPCVVGQLVDNRSRVVCAHRPLAQWRTLAGTSAAALRLPERCSLPGLQVVCMVLHEACSVAVPVDEAAAAATAFGHLQLVPRATAAVQCFS